MKFDKNTVIGLSLMLLIAVGFSWYSAKNKAEAAANAPKQTEQTAQNESTPAPHPVEPGLQQGLAGQIGERLD